MNIDVLTAPELSFLLWTSLILLAVVIVLIVRAVRSRRGSADKKR